MIRTACTLTLLALMAGCGERHRGDLSDGDLKQMVNRLFVDDDPNRENFHGLLHAGKRAVPFLVQALDEARTQTSVFPRTHFDFTGNSPFHRICDLLGNTPSPEAVKPLARYLRHPNPEFRRDAAAVLGRIGTPECLEPVTAALADPERTVREYALLGVLGGLRDKRRNEAFLNGLFPAVVPLLKDGDYDMDGPPEVLAAIDAVRAAPILEAPEYFTTRNPQLRQVLNALNREGHKTPHAILMPLLKELELLSEHDGRRELEYASALRLYARNPDAHAEERLWILLRSSSDAIARGAAAGLMILADIDPDEAVAAAEKRGGFPTMTVSQRYYYAISEYHGEVTNGGHEQYFRNSASDIYPTALEGLHAIGAGTKAAILTEALSVFAPGRASTDRGVRHRQIDGLPGTVDYIWRAADKRYYSSENKPGERIEVLLALFALNYRKDFARVPAPAESFHAAAK